MIDSTIKDGDKSVGVNVTPHVVEDDFPFKYDEGKILDELLSYIKATYGQHYVGKNSVQINDLFLAQDEAEVLGFWRNNAMKYLHRYGKKKGKNRADLLKAVHYTIFLLYLNTLYDDNKEKA